MNKIRREQLMVLSKDIEVIKVRLELVIEAEQEAYDNLPESLQENSNTDVLDSLKEVLDALEELPGAIRGAI